MNDQEIFTTEEENENTKRGEELINLVASGEAILIVGAGSSRRVFYPDWQGLLEELEDLASKQGGFKPNEGKRVNAFLAYAEEIKSHILGKMCNLNRYHALLESLFSPKDPPCTDFHRLLVSLPFRGILTTNYDSVLEAALGEIEPSSAYDNSLVIDDDSAGRVHEFLLSMSDKNITRRIAHLHGKFEPANSIILSIEDYKHAYGLSLTNEDDQPQQRIAWPLHRKLLWAVLATRRVVFVGFSMNDPYFNNMLETVSADLWGWDKSIHFAIMSISPGSAEDSKAKAKRLKSEYGIETVFYEDSDDSHLGLDHIVNEINAKCHAEQSTIVSQGQSGDTDRSEDEKSKPVAGESQEVLDWLEQMTEDMKRRISNEN